MCGLKLELNEAVIKIGKYGIGTNGIILNTKLRTRMLMYPSSVLNGNRSSRFSN
jgi:hypothetical protein